MTPDLAAPRADLAPSGTLRVALNLANFLLIKSALPGGEPVGIAPDIGRELAARLGVPLRFVPYPLPGDLAAAVAHDEWDVGLIGADPLRATEIAFTDAYLEIEASYLVPAGSPITRIEEVDRPGVRIAVADKSAYDMYLRRTIAHATLERAVGLDGSFDLFLAGGLDALAGLRPRLVADCVRLPGSRILDGRFTAVQQAIGTPIARATGAAYLRDFVADIRRSLVGALIDKHRVAGVSVARGDDVATG
jgi:polar amino acid transport system substrate-binding protein